MSGVYHHPEKTYGQAKPALLCWWFMHRELANPEDLSGSVGGTYAIDCSGLPRELIPGCGWLPVVGAVVNDFGDLVPVRRPA